MGISTSYRLRSREWPRCCRAHRRPRWPDSLLAFQHMFDACAASDEMRCRTARGVSMGAAQKSTHLRVRRLPPADLGDGRDDRGNAWRTGILPCSSRNSSVSALTAARPQAAMVDPERNPLSGTTSQFRQRRSSHRTAPRSHRRRHRTRGRKHPRPPAAGQIAADLGHFVKTRGPATLASSILPWIHQGLGLLSDARMIEPELSHALHEKGGRTLESVIELSSIFMPGPCRSDSTLTADEIGLDSAVKIDTWCRNDSVS